MLAPQSFIIGLLLFMGVPVFSQHLYYVPNGIVHSAPVKNARAGIGVGFNNSERYNGLEITADYFLKKRIFLSADWLHSRRYLSDNTAGINMLETALGYGIPIKTGNLAFSGGMGWGNAGNDLGESDTRLYFHRFFAQTNLTLSDNRIFGGLAGRATWVNYTHGKVGGTLPFHEIDYIVRLEQEGYHLISDMGFFFGVIFGNVAFRIQVIGTVTNPIANFMSQSGKVITLEYWLGKDAQKRPEKKD